MKRTLLLVIGLNFFLVHFSQGQINIPQLRAGVYINDSLYTHTYNFLGSCAVFDVEVKIDTSMISLATGVDLKYIITQLTTAPGTVYTVQNGLMNVGDTLNYSAATPSYMFYAGSPGIMELKLIVEGTPQIPFEGYVCHANNLRTLALCNNADLIVPMSAATCSVDNFAGVNDSEPDLLLLYPNPADHKIHLTSKTIYAGVFSLKNILGKEIFNLVIEESGGETIVDVSALSEGIYFWKLTNKETTLQTGKLIMQH